MAFPRRKSAAIGVEAPPSDFIEPALASSIEKVREIDGYCVQVHLANETAKRPRLDPPLQGDRGQRLAHQGELGGRRRRDRGAGQRRQHGFLCPAERAQGSSDRIVLVAFDLLSLNGRDLREEPFFPEKGRTEEDLGGTHIPFSESFEIDGREMFVHACKLGLEGVVTKVRDGPCPSGRSNDWAKKTCEKRETLTLAGFALDEGQWDGIFLGRRKGDGLIYVGKVDHGFDKASTADLQND